MKKYTSSLLIIFFLISIFSFISFFKIPLVEATGETITLTRVGNEKNSQTGKYDWHFTIDTTKGIEDSNIFMKIYEGAIKADNSNLIHQETVGKLKNNHAEANTDFTLDENKNYSINFVINMTPVLHATYRNTAGENQGGGDVVNFTPKLQGPTTGGGKDVYRLLAPIGEFKYAPDNIGEYFNIIFKIAIGLCAVLAVIMIVIGGVQYMGDESIFGKTEAKSRITKAILGLVIALGCYALLNTINPNLLGGGGVNISQVSAEISPEDTSTGSSKSLCISNNPPNPDNATGTTLILNQTIKNEYLVSLDALNLPKGVKLLITSQTAFEGFNSTPSPGTKSYRTKNPGNIGNLDDGTTKSFATLKEGIQAQANIVTRVANNKSRSYKLDSHPTCALGKESYDGSLYQYLRIYATGARISNSYLNAIIGYFKANGKNITARTKISEIYNMQ